MKLIDLSHILNENISVYPDTVPPTFEVSNTVEKDGFTEIKMTLASHSGTHIDAPCHILKDAKSLDQFPLDKLPNSVFSFQCLPLKIENADGSPIREMAMVDEE